MLTALEQEFIETINTEAFHRTSEEIIKSFASRATSKSVNDLKQAQDFVFGLYEKLVDLGAINTYKKKPLIHVLNAVSNFNLHIRPYMVLYYVIGEIRTASIADYKQEKITFI